MRLINNDPNIQLSMIPIVIFYNITTLMNYNNFVISRDIQIDMNTKLSVDLTEQFRFLVYLATEHKINCFSQARHKAHAKSSFYSFHI